MLSFHVSHLRCLLGIITSLAMPFCWLASAQAAALEFDLTQRSQTTATAIATDQSARSVALNFGLAHPSITPTQTSNHLASDVILEVNTSGRSAYAIDDLFIGGANSLVARTVGSAEGTRTASGGYTSAYYGHVDPGNGMWNLGSFSYQHGAASPEQADQKQLRRLQQQAKELRRQTQAKSFQLSLLEELNGIDLANQAPLAALDRGYIDWLYQARAMDLPERIVWARTQAFIDPDTGYWDAPGLGNHWEAIYRDQQRRYDAISRALNKR